MFFMEADFPQPDPPITAMISPSYTSMETRSRTR